MGVTYTTATGATYVPLATTTIGTAVASYTFTSISAAYTDLVLVISARSATAAVADSALLQVGDGSIDTSSVYSRIRLLGQGSGTGSSAPRSAVANIDLDGLAANTATAGTQGTIIINFQNYSNTTTHKTILARPNVTGAYVEAVVGLWRATNAINQIKISTGSTANIMVDSTFSLYGILGA